MKKYKYKFEYKPKRNGKYGYIEFVDERELKHDGFDDNIYPEIRKPTPAESEEIILNYIRANSGQPVWLAEKLGVSDRTIQKMLKKFVRDWHWRSFKFISGVYDENFTKSDAHNQYFHLRRLKEENEKKRKKFRKKD